MNIKNKVKIIFKENIEKTLIKVKRKLETNKFKDIRRKKIYGKINLSDEQKKQIDELFIVNYGEKIPYTWHKHYTAFTGNFDPQYFLELLYIPEFEHFMNHNKEYIKAFSDKNVLPFFAKAVDVKMPKAYISATSGIYHDDNLTELPFSEVISKVSNIGEAFIKPTVDTSSGKGCSLVCFLNGIDIITGRTVAEIIKLMGKDFVLQERVICHESIRKVYPDSVNTFRIITYRWQDGYYHMPIIMRIGQGGNYLDNAHAGGMFIAIDDDGTVHKTAFTEFKQEYIKHPDTGLVFEGYRIDLLPKVIEATKKMCNTISQVGCINWDFTIDAAGEPVLIEANMNGGSIWLVEMAHGCGGFGEKTPEVLKWLKKMKKVGITEYDKYQYGNNI